MSAMAAAERSGPPELASVLSQRWVAEAPKLATAFHTAEPFPFLILDDFLEPEFAWQLFEEFPSLEQMPKSRSGLFMFANKHELSSIDGAGPASARYHSLVTSQFFADFLCDVTGYQLFVDPALFGGGFHQSGDGGFLDMHVDFNVHPLHSGWLRVVNILLYLNPDWREEFGGHLLLKSLLHDEPRAVAPIFNRAVIMVTNETTYHGYDRMELPPGITRRSLASYAYRRVDMAVPVRATGWVPAGAGPFKRLVARNYNAILQAKNSLFGIGGGGNPA
jgi:hypothetical protein